MPVTQERNRRANIATAAARHQDGQAGASSDSSDGAVQQVFATAELLEMILLELPMRTLFGVRRVCKTFATAISGSKKLRVAMFLEVAEEPATSRINPLIHKIAYRLAEEDAFACCTDSSEELDNDGSGLTLPILNFKAFGQSQLQGQMSRKLVFEERKGAESESWAKLLAGQGRAGFKHTFRFYGDKRGILTSQQTQPPDASLYSLLLSMNHELRYRKAIDSRDFGWLDNHGYDSEAAQAADELLWAAHREACRRPRGR